MNQSELEHFLGNHPTLYHFAEPGAWEAIRLNGLLSTSALLDLYGVSGNSRFRLESMKRSQTERLTKAGLPDAFIRDQHAINETNLRQALTPGITPRQWYEFLNGKVFFWAAPGRLYGMAKAYDRGAREVIAFDTALLVAAYRDHIRLSHMNSGATRSPYHYRGYGTFCRIEDYPYSKRRKKVAEVCIEVGVPDVVPFVQFVRQLKGSTWGSTIYSPDLPLA